MLSFQKGEKFPLPPQTEEGVVFSVEPYTMMLIYYFRKPTGQEREAFCQGNAQLAVAKLKDTLFILSRFAPMSWMDVPYSTHLSESFKRFPDLKPNQGYAVDAFLVDCDTNVLMEHRLMHLDTASSFKMRDLILEDQERTEFSLQQYQETVREIYRNYPPKELLKRAVFTAKMRA